MSKQASKTTNTKATGAPAQRSVERWIYVAVVGMLACYFALSQSAAATKSAGFDEPIHLAGGYCYWKFGDFRLQPENGNLPQRWATLPLYLSSSTHFPALAPGDWRMPSTQAMGNAFLFGARNDADGMLKRGRAMIGLLGVVLGWVIFITARKLLGTAPAMLSLALFACCPSMLAQGALITSDMAVTLFFTASVLCIWRVLHVVNWWTLIGGSLVVACLLLSKLSGLLIVPMSIVLLVVRLASSEPAIVVLGNRTWRVEQRSARLMVHLMTIVAQAIMVVVVIWGFYNFRYEMFATKSDGDREVDVVSANVPEIPWKQYLDESRSIDRFIAVARDWRLLPEGSLFGVAVMLHNAQSRAAFLNGEYSVYGWLRFFPYSVLVKTPLTLLALLVLALAWNLKTWYTAGENWRSRAAALGCSLYRTAPLGVLFLVYWCFAMASHLNIGHRHILPTYPPMLVFAGCAWMWVAERRAVQENVRSTTRVVNWLRLRRHPVVTIVVLASIVSLTSESLACWPNYLAYFNPLVGSRTNAYRHLVDSSLDWGQDLPALKQWLAEASSNMSQNDATYLSYFGAGKPEYYDIHATPLPGFWDRSSPGEPQPLKAGTYCISATLLQNLYSKYPGRWNREYEAEYQQLAAKVRRFGSLNGDERKKLFAREGQQAAWDNLFQTYEHSRFARLTSFLRRREPDSEINYSILVYHLTADDLDRAINGPPMELVESADLRN